MPRKPIECGCEHGEPLVVKSSAGDAKLLILEDKMQKKLAEELVSKVAIGKVQVGTKYEAGTSLEKIIRDMLTLDSRVLTGIRIVTPPTKTVYTVGELFDTAGMKVEAMYDDASSEIVTDYTYTPATALAITDTTITVAYEGKTANQAITVNASALTIYKGVRDAVPTTVEEVEALTKDTSKSKSVLLDEGYTYKNISTNNQFAVLAINKASGLLCYDIQVAGFSMGFLVKEIGDYYLYHFEMPTTESGMRYLYLFEEDE